MTFDGTTDVGGLLTLNVQELYDIATVMNSIYNDTDEQGMRTVNKIVLEQSEQNSPERTKMLEDKFNDILKLIEQFDMLIND